MYKVLVTIEDAPSGDYLLDKPSFIIGRGKSSDIRIISEDVSRQHAKLSLVGQKVFIEDLGSANGIFINEKKVTKEELTTFFPAHLSPRVTLHLESLEKIRPAPRPRPKPRPFKKELKEASKKGMDPKGKILIALICAAVAASAFYIASELLREDSRERPPVQITGTSFALKNLPPEKLCSNEALVPLCKAFRTSPQKGYGFYFEKDQVQGVVSFTELSALAPNGLSSKDDYREVISSKLNGGVINKLAEADAKVLTISFVHKKKEEEIHYSKCELDLMEFLKGADKKDGKYIYDSKARKRVRQLLKVTDS